jgi:hypothetical protein
MFEPNAEKRAPGAFLFCNVLVVRISHRADSAISSRIILDRERLLALCEASVLHRYSRFSLFFACCVVLAAARQSVAQARPSAPPPPLTQPRGDINSPGDGEDPRNQAAEELAKKAAKERVAALKSDTDKLLKLSVELKAYVDKSDENVLSLDVIRKAEEIERLAKSVKDKMKGPN